MKLGKKGKEWNKARVILKKEFEEKSITYCEICGETWGMSFHHRNKRRFNDPHTFDNVLLLCAKCHHKAEYDRKITKQWFKRKRD